MSYIKTVYRHLKIIRLNALPSYLTRKNHRGGERKKKWKFSVRSQWSSDSILKSVMRRVFPYGLTLLSRNGRFWVRCYDILIKRLCAKCGFAAFLSNAFWNFAYDGVSIHSGPRHELLTHSKYAMTSNVRLGQKLVRYNKKKKKKNRANVDGENIISTP